MFPHTASLMLALVQWLQATNITLFHLINGHWIRPLLDPVMITATQLGRGEIQVGLLAVCFLRGNHATRRTALLCLLAYAVSGIAVQVLKNLCDTPRPAAVLDDCRCLAGILRAHSFPSGHTTTAFAIAVVAAQRERRWAIPLLLLAALVGYSRVYVGAHFPSDVLGGAVLGILSALFCLALAPRFRRKKEIGAVKKIARA